MEKVNLKEKTVCVIDERLCVSLAQRLAKDFGKVLYFSDWTGPFPYSKDNLVGTGIEGVERIETFWDKIDDIDCFVFPFVYKADWQQHLKDLGKRVWGSGYAEQVELDREDTNKDIHKFGLPNPEIKKIVGVDNLREHLKTVEDKYIKVSKFRGNGETWHHQTYELSEPLLNEMDHKIGAEKPIFEFIVEDPIKGIEWGYDGFCIDGKFPKKTLCGVEKKDCAYAGHIKNHDDISHLITDYVHAIAPTLELNHYRQFFHTENRITAKKESHPIDITTRMGLPPGELYMEICSNISDVIYHGAAGDLVEPEFEAEYGIQCNIYSDWADGRWQGIKYPDNIDRWVKLRNCMKYEGTWYIIPGIEDFCEIGAVIAIGDSLDECIEKVKKYAEQIKGYLVEVKTKDIDSIKECISEAAKIGILF